ncbi:MAG: alkaline phosphatase family protein [Anaerolineae bacterium]|nr:alkaline phosphatase family protein [Anaerolineae bacterium]
MSLAAQIQAELEARTLPHLDGAYPPGEFVMPHYDGLGIANLPATIAQTLGAKLSAACSPLRSDLCAGWSQIRRNVPVRRVVLVVFDALGYLQLLEAMQADPSLVFHRLAAAGSLLPLTSTFLSTTCTALTTLWTGCAPAAHGSLAFEVFLREFGAAASILFFWPVHHHHRDALTGWGLNPETFIPLPGLAQQLAAQGVVTHSLIDKSYASSAFTRMTQRGVKATDGFISAGDMWLGLQRALAQYRDKKLFLTLYCGTVDGITHQYSPADPSWTLELRSMARMLEEGFLAQLTPEQRRGTLLLITADHGGVDTPLKDAIQLKHHPDLRDALRVQPLGESRAPFLYARPDTLDLVQRYMQERLGRSFVTWTRQQVLDSGLLGPGPLYRETPHRLGDLVAVARGSHFLAQSDYHLQMKGRHGGLSAREMLVPLLAVRLDAL